jgi:lipoprotein signal peptidase
MLQNFFDRIELWQLITYVLSALFMAWFFHDHAKQSAPKSKTDIAFEHRVIFIPVVNTLAAAICLGIVLLMLKERIQRWRQQKKQKSVLPDDSQHS